MNRAVRPFTGRRMALIIVAFFGVVISVNVTMAVFASTTFGGKVVDNSYVATQRFIGWLEEARAQERLGWSETVRLGSDRHVELDLSHAAAPLAGATIEAEARHPVGREDDVALRFSEVAPGRYRSEQALPPGRWRILFVIAANGAEKRLIETLR